MSVTAPGWSPPSCRARRGAPAGGSSRRPAWPAGRHPPRRGGSAAAAAPIRGEHCGHVTRLHQPQPGAHLGELVEDVHEQEALGEGERLELEYRGLVAREVEAPHGRLLGVQQVQDLK